MASLPGFPGNRGLPPSGSPSGNLSSSDASFDLPSGSSSSILLANRTFFPPDLGGPTSGSFSIPSTTPGNLLVILVASEQRGQEKDPLVISDNAGDAFTQVPWYSIPGSGATDVGTVAFETAHAADLAGPGFMTCFPSPGWASDPTSAAAGFGGNFDAWYATTNGGATTITWATGSSSMGFAGISPLFWVYELRGTNWQLVDFKVATGGEFSNPYIGPALSGAGAHNVYFSLINTNSAFQPGGTVALPWTLDASWQVDDTLPPSLAYVLDSIGAQQAVFSSSDGPDWFVSHGVVFSGTPGGGGGGGGSIFQPNVCIVC